MGLKMREPGGGGKGVISTSRLEREREIEGTLLGANPFEVNASPPRQTGKKI